MDCTVQDAAPESVKISPSPGRSAFTLIELLVVVAIIALLTSILLPTVHKAKELARTAVCATQLKQIGLAVHYYVQEYNEFLPPFRMRSHDNYWTYMLSEHLGRERNNGRTSNIFLCPDDPAPYGQVNGVPNESDPFWFGYTGYGSYGAGNQYFRWFYDYDPAKNKYYYTRYSSVPSTGVMILDHKFVKYINNGAPGSTYWPIFWHDGYVNVLFGGLHVEPMDEVQLHDTPDNK